MTSWITCQLGAREHYAIPRSLHAAGSLHTAIVDAWVPPRSALCRVPKIGSAALRDRYHSDLADANVQSFTQGLLAFELNQRLTRLSSWSSIIARNRWFQHRALRKLKRLEAQFSEANRPTLFCYSYTALALFRYAKQRGWRTVLGQIDPALAEEQQVTRLQNSYGQKYQSSWRAAPAHYWQNWQKECDLADQVLVNSAWSQQALETARISSDKIKVVPLAYAANAEEQYIRQYPKKFTAARPLRVLFLGQIILRKGIAALLEALACLGQAPVEIWLVGSTELVLPNSLRDHPQIKWVGAVPRSQVHQYYQQADVFLFPTHSDGFGLTQLEAQAWRLPVIASRHCGEIVHPEKNGLVLETVSGQSIADSLLWCAEHPQQLKRFSERSIDLRCFSLAQLQKNLQSVFNS